MADELADRPAAARVDNPETVGRGFFHYERYRVALPDGNEALKRDVLRVGGVVVVLAVDLARDEIILIREFRLGAHLANGKGDVVEVPAGRVDRGEAVTDAARRECLEEIGVAPKELVQIFTVLPSPGTSDELMNFFLGAVDAAQVPERAGAAHEQEHTRPERVRIDDALAALAADRLHYGATIFALQWLALNRARLKDILQGAAR